MKELRAWVFLIIFQLTWIIPVAIAGSPEQVDVIAAENEEDIIRWKEGNEENAEVTVKTLEQYEQELYNVPLSEELQLHIFAECEKYNISPAIIIAMIERESGFKSDKIGDDGKSFGLMQIQPIWWQELMDELGCDDMLDPFQNITVGIAIIDYFKDKNPDIYWVLMNYNMSSARAQELWDKGEYSDYALEVVERAEELERERENAKK